MNSKSKYNTRQREVLLDYLETMPGTHITVNDVCEYCKNQGKPIGQSTVYRQLERMVDEGLVNKYIIDANSPACFEYVPEQEQVDLEMCFHCKCERCGKLIHLRCEELAGIAAHLQAQHRFLLDPKRTVFYGICEECAAEEEQDAPEA